MPQARKPGELPATKPYRVCTVGAVYDRFVEVVDDDGEDAVRKVRDLATFGQTVELTEREARRLTALDVVRPAGDPLTYDEMNDKQLDKVISDRAINVRSTGADADQPLRTDKINALLVYDQGRGVAGRSPVTGS